MEKRARLLLRGGSGAAALLLMALALPRYGAVYVGGGSMRPTCTAGDLAIYRRGCSGVRERDVILFTRGGSRVLHRVTATMLDGALRTRGDANPTPDPERVSRADVQGVVVAVIPCGRLIDSMVAGGRWCYNHVPIANMRR